MAASPGGGPAELVSVIIPAFRAHDTIARAVGSLIAQTHGAWEAILVSDDRTDYAASLRAAGLDDPRIRHASTGEVGSGAPAARNCGLAEATGAFIAPLDADDLYESERLATLVPLAARAGAAADNVRIVDDASGADLGTLLPPSEEVGEMDLDTFLGTSVPMMFVARREVAGAWDADVELCDDVAFNTRLFDRLGRIPVTGRPLHDYRVRPGSICHGPGAAARAERGYHTVLARLDADGFGIARPDARAALKRAVLRKMALNSAFEDARRAGRCETFQEFIAAGGGNR